MKPAHRIGAIRRLRWSDIDFEHRRINWRAECEKSGYAHSTPKTQAVRTTLEKARQLHPRIGDGPILPSVSEPSRPAPPYYMRDLRHKAESAVGLGRKNGRGWHSVRSKFARSARAKSPAGCVSIKKRMASHTPLSSRIPRAFSIFLPAASRSCSAIIAIFSSRFRSRHPDHIDRKNSMSSSSLYQKPEPKEALQ